MVEKTINHPISIRLMNTVRVVQSKDFWLLSDGFLLDIGALIVD